MRLSGDEGVGVTCGESGVRGNDDEDKQSQLNVDPEDDACHFTKQTEEEATPLVD